MKFDPKGFSLGIYGYPYILGCTERFPVRLLLLWSRIIMYFGFCDDYTNFDLTEFPPITHSLENNNKVISGRIFERFNNCVGLHLNRNVASNSVKPLVILSKLRFLL